MVKHDTLLVCSHVRENRQELRRVFSDSYNLLEAANARQMILLLNQNIGCVAAVLVDITNLEVQTSNI